MNAGKLAKRLKKELAAHPKQAAVLGIGCLVAIWFWAPLVMQWWKPKGASTGKKAVVEAKPSGPAAVAAQPGRPAGEKKITWFELKALREADPLTQPAPWAENTRDPFQSSFSAQVATSGTADVQETLPHAGDDEIDPAKLGLVLESIAYGGKRRRAQISGQTFKENDGVMIAPATPGEDAETIGHVKAIRPTDVLLELQGKLVRLKLKSKSLGHGNVFERID